jgi:DNA-directed RNA polymerase specialized sigma24 family protein
MNVPGVEYREVVHSSSYRVGDDGSLWSQKSGEWKRLKGYVAPDGYVRVILSHEGRLIHKPLHHLILEAFVGPRPHGMEACHDPDPDRSNNRLSNLRWDTRRANTDDKMRLGRQAKGEENGISRLSARAVLEMRALAESGVSNADIAKRFDCNYRTVSLIVTGMSWRHVGGPIREKKTGGTVPRIFIGGETVKEIANRLGVTIQAVHYRLKRGLPLEVAA